MPRRSRATCNQAVRSEATGTCDRGCGKQHAGRRGLFPLQPRQQAGEQFYGDVLRDDGGHRGDVEDQQLDKRPLLAAFEAADFHQRAPAWRQLEVLELSLQDLGRAPGEHEGEHHRRQAGLPGRVALAQGELRNASHGRRREGGAGERKGLVALRPEVLVARPQGADEVVSGRAGKARRSVAVVDRGQRDLEGGRLQVPLAQGAEIAGHGRGRGGQRGRRRFRHR